MQDTIIKGTGDSRTLKGPPNLLAMYPTWQDAALALQNGTFPIDLGPLNPLGCLQIGTGYTKAEVLPAGLQATLNLPALATPADAFQALYRNIYGSDEHIYRWLRRRAKYVEKQTKITGTVLLATVESKDNSITIERSKSVSVNPLTGQMELSASEVSTKKLSQWTSTYDFWVTGYYFKVVGNSTVYKNEGNYFFETYDGGYALALNPAKGTIYTISTAPSTTEQMQEIVTSTDPNAYPVAGDGWTYTELDPLPIVLPCLRAQTGYYSGTGTYGPDNPNSLTFEFAPKILMVTNFTDESKRMNTLVGKSNIRWLCDSMSLETGSYTVHTGLGETGQCWGRKSNDGKTLYWYHGVSPSYQFNLSGSIYYYTAIG